MTLGISVMEVLQANKHVIFMEKDLIKTLIQLCLVMKEHQLMWK